MKRSGRFPLQLRNVLITALVASFLLLPVKGKMFGDIRFKSFNDDRDRLENYIERGKDASEMAEWDAIVQGGREAMEAEWERDAGFKIDRIIREEGDTPGLRVQLEREKEEAFAQWERAIDAKIAEEAGQWYARRQNILYGSFDIDRFRSALQETANIDPDLTSQEKIDEWDLIIYAAVGSITADWEDSLDTTLARLRERAGDLTGARREAFLREADRIEEELRDRFRLEGNQFVWRERNRYVTDLLLDGDSLRRISEEKSAGAITDRILSDTIEDIKEEEDKILKRDADVPGEPGAIDFSKIGANWEEEIRRLVERGLEKWKQAQEKLYEAMREWKEDAEKAYEEGNRIWQEAYDRLVKAREEWQDNIREEIDRGLSEWREKEAGLEDNIARSRQDLVNYLTVQQEQWQTSSQGLREMAVNASNAHALASENIVWLESEMIPKYQSIGYYYAGLSNYNFSSDWGSIDQVRELILNAVKHDSRRYAFLSRLESRDGLFGFYKDWGSSFNLFDPMRWRGPFVRPSRHYDALVIENFNITPVASNTYNSSTDTVTEYYTVYLSMGYMYWNDNPGKGSLTNETQTVHFTNTINASTPDSRKSRFYYYATENDSWRDTGTGLYNLMADVEYDIHNRNMLGEEGGPGYLRNSEGTYGLKYLSNGKLESDPYLMTAAEYSYELVRRELEYREQRLRIAEAVMMYAHPSEYEDNEFAPGGKREDAETTERRRLDAETEMNRAKALYETSLNEVAGIVDQLNQQKTVIANLIGQLAAKQDELNQAWETYNGIKEQVLSAENSGSAAPSLLADLKTKRDSYNQVQSEYNAIKSSLDQAQMDYNTINNTYVNQMNTISELYQRYQDSEFDYERACAVWEYASTSYLKDTFAHDSDLGTGQVPGSDETVDYDTIQVPDARENYQRMLSNYEDVRILFLDAENFYQNQETVELLSMDNTYSTLRDDFENATIAYMNNPTEETLNARNSAVAIFQSYCNDTIFIGVHDGTVILRDQEQLYSELLQIARDANSHEAYNLLISELVSDGNGTAIEEQVVNSIVQQNLTFNQQTLEQQRNTFSERKNRWIEVVGYIMNRGERDWTNNLNSFANRWQKWKSEMQQRIEEGGKEWSAVIKDFNTRMVNWQKQVSVSASDESSEKIIVEITEKVDNYLKQLNRSLPEGVKLDIDVGSIIGTSLSSQPAGIGILTDSMKWVDTTAGLSDILNLGATYGNTDRYREKMADFQNNLEKMQIVKMTEGVYVTFQEILANFEKQLAEANKNVYNQVKTDLRDEFDAPFKRMRLMWKLRYIADYTAAKGEEKEDYYIPDYQNFRNRTVLIKPIKGLGSEIDFENPYSYQNLDVQDLQVYVKLEEEHLNREIENVFAENGLFQTHVTGEFERLADDFSNAYRKYMEGKAKKKGGRFNAPIASGLPSPRVIAQVGASIALTATGNPWAAFALNSAMTAYDVQQRTLDWEHAAVQTGVSFASSYMGGLGYVTASQSIYIAASGIEYKEDGDLGWSNENLQEGIKAGAVSIALSGAFSAHSNGWLDAGLTAGKRGFIMSGLETDGEWYELGFDNDHWSEHLTAGMAAGVTASTMYLIGDAAGWNKAQLDAEGKPITGARDPFDPNIFMHGYTERAMSGLLNSSMMTLGYNLRDGEGFRNDYSDINWSSMLYTHQDLAGTIGLKAAYETNDYLKRYEESRAADERDRAKNDPLNKADELLGGILLSLRRGAEDVEGIYESIRSGAGDLFESAVNYISHGEFVSDREMAVAAAMDEMRGVYGKYHEMVDLQQSRDMWNAGVMDLMIGINRGQIKGVNYSFTGDGGIALYATSNQPVQSAIRHFSIYDLNAASTFGKTGGYKDSALKRNMRELTEKLGASAKEIQELYDAGMLPDSVANAIALTAVEGMSDSELNRFMKSYTVAAGLSSGYIQQRNGGYYNNAGRRVAGEWRDQDTSYIMPEIVVTAQRPGIDNPFYDPQLSGELRFAGDVLEYSAMAMTALYPGLAAGSILSAPAYRIANFMLTSPIARDAAFAGAIGAMSYLASTPESKWNLNDLSIATGTHLLTGGLLSPMTGRYAYQYEMSDAKRFLGGLFVGSTFEMLNQVAIGGVKNFNPPAALWTGAMYGLGNMTAGWLTDGRLRDGKPYSYFWTSGLANTGRFIPSVVGSWGFSQSDYFYFLKNKKQNNGK